MAVPVARVHLKVAHAALPALLPTPPKCNMLPLLSTPPPCAAAILPKPLAAKLGRADAEERWDARKTKPACPASSASSSSGAGHGSPPRKNATSPPPKPRRRADSVERWDAHEKAASSASLSLSSETSSLASSSNCHPISRAMSTERWDAHKKAYPPQSEPLDDGESCSIDRSGDIDTEEEILWKPRVTYAGPGFVVAAPESRMLPMPTAFVVSVA